MILESLIPAEKRLQATGKLQQNVESLAIDSRRVVPGAVFFAVPGLRTDGARYVEEAASRGAVAIVSEKPIWTPPRVACIVVADVRETLADAARRFYGNPQDGMELTAICGTSGKTVVSTLLRHFLEKREVSGMLGTVHYALGRRTLPAYRTTPEPIELYGMLAQMKEAGCSRCILELSSHGIHQGRVKGLAFSTAAWLNLSPEHLDYHGDMEHYYRVIADALTGENAPQNLILGLDDPMIQRFIRENGQRVGMMTFGTQASADCRAEDIELGVRSTKFRFVWDGGELTVVSPLVGAYNVQNVLAAFALGMQAGLQPAEMAGRLIDFEGVRGRLERVDHGQPFNLIVDYAHTEAAYRKVLSGLREITEGRLITVFGCGGNRDPKARPLMTRAVTELSDCTVMTADNPRNETVEGIFDDMRPGVHPGSRHSFVADRRAAIAAAIEMARPGDTVLIAGKGHETFQEFADCVTPFDDRAAAREILRNRDWSEISGT